MFWWLILILFALSGYLMKLSDNFYDNYDNTILASIFGIFCAIVTGLLITNNIDAVYIFSAIIIGTLFSKKIDGIHHTLTLITLICFVLIYGFNLSVSLTVFPLILCTIGAFVDEWGNDNPNLKNSFLKFFFDHRFTMKLIVLFLSIASLLNQLYNINTGMFSGLSFMAIIYFLAFEISYEVADVSSEKINNLISKYYLIN